MNGLHQPDSQGDDAEFPAGLHRPEAVPAGMAHGAQSPMNHPVLHDTMPLGTVAVGTNFPVQGPVHHSISYRGAEAGLLAVILLLAVVTVVHRVFFRGRRRGVAVEPVPSNEPTARSVARARLGL